MRRRTPVTLAFVVLAAVAALIGVLWILVAPPRGTVDAGAQAELARLRAAEESQGGTTPAKRTVPRLCEKLTRTRAGRVADDGLTELSGLVASRRTAGLFWAIEDSGAQPVLSALRKDGSLAGNWTVPGAENVDWEDVAAGPSPTGPMLYAADIGDNDHERASISVYRVPEPASPVGGGQTAPAARLELRYPDGAHDAEALIVDPVRGTLLIVTKDWSGGLYALSKPLPFGGQATLRRVSGDQLAFATAADVSADGTTVALRGYFSLEIWRRRGDEPLTTTMKRRPCTSPTPFDDGQGEAIALSGDGRRAWSVAEGEHPPIYAYRAQ